jgi:hypothetical protein
MEREQVGPYLEANGHNREGPLSKEMEYREVINLPMPPPHLLLPDQRVENPLPLGTGRVVTKTPDFEDVNDEDSISPPPSIDSSPSTLSSPPATDPDPPNLLAPVMPDNSDQPFVPDDNPSSQEQPPPTPILLPDGLKRPIRNTSTAYQLKKD